MERNNKLSPRIWAVIILVGIIGQLAWAIENNYINMWVFSQTGSTDSVTLMTIFSALAATLTTFFIGLLSDRIGRRKIFISLGYIIWGVSVFSFGLLSYHNMLSITKNEANAILLVGVGMTVLDVVMTFFGSSSNDAAFNAWVTEHTNKNNRGKVESLLSIMPLFANVFTLAIGLPLNVGAVPNETLKADVANGKYLDSQDALAHSWFLYFLLCGLFVTIVGIISIFLVPKDDINPNREGSYFKKLLYGFKPQVIKNNKTFYLLLLSFFGFNSAINAFMPYYLIYFQRPIESYGVGFGSDISFYIAFGIILIVSSLIMILVGIFLMNRVNRFYLFYSGLALGVLGCLGLFLARETKWLNVLFGTILITGYLICTAILGAAVRDKTPEKEVGLFQGVRMVFAVLLPMITGPLISQALFPIKSMADDPYTSASLGGKTPSNIMFIVSLAFLIASLFPIICVHRGSLKEKRNENDISGDKQ